jgi:hypothetical protein
MIEWFLDMFFIFGKKMKFYYRGHVDMVRFISLYHKEDL